jgi:hypothetical protein
MDEVGVAHLGNDQQPLKWSISASRIRDGILTFDRIASPSFTDQLAGGKFSNDFRRAGVHVD